MDARDCPTKVVEVQGSVKKDSGATFKQLAVHNEISKLNDEDGKVQIEWDEISEVARRHFTRLIGSTSEIMEEAI